MAEGAGNLPAVVAEAVGAPAAHAAEDAVDYTALFPDDMLMNVPDQNGAAATGLSALSEEGLQASEMVRLPDNLHVNYREIQAAGTADGAASGAVNAYKRRNAALQVCFVNNVATMFNLSPEAGAPTSAAVFVGWTPAHSILAHGAFILYRNNNHDMNSIMGGGVSPNAARAAASKNIMMAGTYKRVGTIAMNLFL